MAYIGQVPSTGDNSFRILDDITSYTLTFDGSSSSVVSTTNYTITQINHRFVTAQRVTYTHGGGTAIGGLTSGTAYFIIKVDQNTIKLATTAVNANNNAAIDLNALGTGTSHTLNVAFDSVNTKFKATYNNGTKAQLTRAAQLQISINGVIQQPQDSITPVNGFGLENDSTIVFSTAPSSTDVFWGNVIANSYPTFDVSDNTVDTFTGNGSQTNFTLSKTPANNQNVLVTINGVVQYPSDATTSRSYSVDANVLNFTSAPSGGSIIQVRHIGFAGATSSAVTGFYGRTGNVGLTTADNVVIGTATIGVGAAGTSLLVQGNARITGILTVGSSSVTIDGSNNQVNVGTAVTITSSSFQIGSSNLHSTGIEVTNVNATGVGTFASLSVSGNVSIAGTVTYDDVTNVDSIGIVTARTGVRVDAGGLVVTSGVSTFTNSPVLIGSGTSTGTASQKLQVTGGAYVSGNDNGNGLGIGVTNPVTPFDIRLNGGNAASPTIRIAPTTATNAAGILFASSASSNFYTGLLNSVGALNVITGLTPYAAVVGNSAGTTPLLLVTNALERVRVTDTGLVGIGTTNPIQKLQVYDGSINVYRPTGEVNIQLESGDTSVAAFRAVSPYRNWRFGIQGGANADFVIRDTTSSANRLGITSAGEVIIGSNATPLVPTGTASQPLQVTGGAYVSGSLGIGTTNPTSQFHITGQFQSTQANSTTTGGGQIYLNGATGNRIDFNINGIAAPAFTTRSVGTKIVLSHSIGSVSSDYAFGIENGGIWYSVDQPLSTKQHRWYGGITQLADLKGSGELVLGGVTTLTGTASQKLQVTGGAYVSGSLGIGTTNPQAPLHVVGTGQTALLVSGNARITGILTVGTSSLTFDGNANTITGLSTVTGSSSFSKPNLSGISSTITATAVDVFVYDTRKDSDGGAWRKRTQHTSWYNETLNTETRGSRRDFPAVAVIVATAAPTRKLYIYDGDDPDMPMWMVIDTTDGQWPQTEFSSLSALNGIIALGSYSNTQPAYETRNRLDLYYFVSDKIVSSGDGTGNSYYGIIEGIVNRRSHASNRGTSTGETVYQLVNHSVNDVAMTVLPNAPIDAATGLPVPTIAVATNGGTSIIRDDGTVTNAGGTTTTKISINEKGIVYFASTANGGYYGYSLVGGSLDSFFNTVGYLRILSNVNSNTNNNLVVPNAFNLYSGQTIGLTIVNKDFLNTYNDYNGMVAYATTSYNTGWMHGDIKGAFLSDTSTASVTGTELITNGDFATSTLTSYSQLYNCSLSVVSNQLRVTSTAASGYCEFYIGISDTTKYHYFSFQFVGASGITQFGIYANLTGYITDTNAGWSNSSYVASRSAGTYTLLIPPGNAQVGFVFNIASLGQTWTFDNISLRKVTEVDRSVNNRGLAVYGTLTKTAVATNSNLVGYSGFSLSNYLVQPYNSALVAGTGSQCFMGWVYTSGLDANLRYPFTVGRQDSNEQFRLGFSSSATYFDYGSGSQYIQWSGNAIPSNTWTFVVAMVTAGQAGRVFINGVELTSPSYSVVAPSTFLTDATFVTTIGTRHDNHYGGGSTNAVWNGSISLVRYSLSIPSPEQILKIYNDEKTLFQPNSQCTLYGASDAVTALAYDDSNSLLSVGTSSGRSDFRGLERINNTTTAVTTAISASNGLIAEQ